MGLEQQLDQTLTRAIKDRDTRTAEVVRMIKTRLAERRTAKGFAGEVDAGDRAASQVAQIRFEVGFCERYLPKGLDEAAVQALVRARLGALGITDAKQVGRLVGDIMKTHKGQVEAADVKRIAEEQLKG